MSCCVIPFTDVLKIYKYRPVSQFFPGAPLLKNAKRSLSIQIALIVESGACRYPVSITVTGDFHGSSLEQPVRGTSNTAATDKINIALDILTLPAIGKHPLDNADTC